MTEKRYDLGDVDNVSKGIIYKPADVEFTTFDDYKNQATEIAKFINDIVLTEDNIPMAKATLAAARKVTDNLDRKRIDLKRELLGNFTVFENQINELKGIVSHAESDLRSKVRDYEERERENKKEQIAVLWDKRYPAYTLSRLAGSYETFVKWLKPSYMNKSVTMKSVEKEMVAWLEQREADITSCQSMGDEYLTEYLISLDLPTAINAVKTREEKAKAVSEMRSDDMTEWVDDEDDDIAVFHVIGLVNIELTERLLKEHKIPYVKK